MLLVLQVKSYRDQPLAGRYCVIASGTGTMGRAEGNDLVLDDPGKYISRVHARVEQRGELFYLTDIGSNPSVINDRLLGNGQEIQLVEGDCIVIGEYRLEVQMQNEALVEAPVTDEDDSASQPRDLTLAVFGPAAPPLPASTAPTMPIIDTLAAPKRYMSLMSPSTDLPDPLAAARILENGPLIEANLPLSDPLGLDLFAQSQQARMTGLDEACEALLQPAFRGAENDHLSPELQAFPSSAITAAVVPVAMAQAEQAVTPLLIPADYDPLADLVAAPTPPLTSAPASEPVPEVVTLPEAAPTGVAVDTDSTGAAPRDDGVLQALLDGLGLPDLRTSREPRDLARLAGEMLREAVGGTMDVLLARAMTKRDSHIDMTMIGARRNNPLKFFPNPESALSQMLSTDAPAYLSGVSALEAAFDDLKAHELAVIVGMRAALEEVVQRFEPARIEQQLAVRGRFDKLMPCTRKARLWDQLTALYTDLVRDGDEDLQRIFGEKFALAYQQQIARLRTTR